MRRRVFITLLSCAAAARPHMARAQQGEPKRRVGVLLPAAADDQEYPALVRAFIEGLRQRGWVDGHNLQLDIRFSGGGAEGITRDAFDLAAATPDVIIAPGSASVGPLLQATRTVSIVFMIVPDPVGAGFVGSLARPGGNATGFTSFEYGIGVKWLELLRDIAPGRTRVGVLRDPAITAGIGQWDAIQAAAPALGLEAISLDLRGAGEIERDMAALAGIGNASLIVTSSALSVRHRDLIVLLAARHRLPAVYYASAFVRHGGLLSYGPDRADQFRRAADYADRILRGEKPADLPVQTPTQYELVVNLKAARTLGLDIPGTLLARADEVIE